ncbi:protein of unknown function [Candidatus Filomicrobium marinum]|nr:helix-turn-helix domain-containing protein [Candidatus Filomicrobium marinum]CFX59248.1 protein of unknown function [Candidatus Filomicrobium marinum]
MRATATAFKSESITEVYREETETGVITFHEKIESSKPKVRRNLATIDQVKGVGPEKRMRMAVRGRAFRLLGSLAKVYATRRPALFRSRHRLALLTIAGNLLALVAEHDNRSVGLASLQKWADKYIDGATRAEVALAFEAVMMNEGYRTIQSPSAVGFDLELDKLHWLRAGRPWGIHPADMTKGEVLKLQRAMKKARDKQRAAAKRAASGSTPRSTSVSEIARKLGISRPTLYKRMRSGGFDNAAEFYSFVSPIKSTDYKSDESVNSCVRPAASAAASSPRRQRPRRKSVCAERNSRCHEL